MCVNSNNDKIYNDNIKLTSLGTDRAVEERLDRALANEAWFHLFPNASLDNLVVVISYYYLILLTGRDVLFKLEGCAEDLKHWNKTLCNMLKNYIEY